MPRKVKEVPLNNRTVRGKLPPAGKPYFRLIGEGMHLGYRRPATAGRAGAWVGRRQRADVGAYETEGLGQADDLPSVPADGKTVLTFEQAQARLREWDRGRAAEERAKAEAGKGAPTVRDAVNAYTAARTKRAEKAGKDASFRLARHVLSAPIADRPLNALTESDFAEWRRALRQGGRRKAGTPPKELAPATEVRLFNDLRAALTAAASKHGLDIAVAIKGGLKAPEAHSRPRDLQILSDADVRRVVDAAREEDPDFGMLVMVLAATGARLDQVSRITVADLQPDNGRVMVPASRKGRAAKAKPPIATPLPPDVVSALRPLIAGRKGNERLLMRWHHVQVSPNAETGWRAWKQDGRRPWTDSSEVARPWSRTIARAGLSEDLAPYCLRHSSIVRGLRAGLPVRLVAAAHDTSTAMIEAHYSAHIVDASEELLRRAMMPLAAAEVTELPKAKRLTPA